MNENTLMFQVAIADVQAELNKQKKAIEKWVDGNPIRLKISLDGLEQQLRAMGVAFGNENTEVKRLREELAGLKKDLEAALNSKNSKGAGNIISATTEETKKLGEAAKQSGHDQAEAIITTTRLGERYQKLLYQIESQMRSTWQTSRGFASNAGYVPGELYKEFRELASLRKDVRSMSGSEDKDILGVLLARFSRIRAEYKDMRTEAERFNKESEKISNQADKTFQKIAELSSPNNKVSLVSGQNTEEIRKQIDAIGALYMRIKEIQGIKVDSPKSWDQLLFGGNWKKYEGSYQEQMEVFRQTVQRVQKELSDMQSRGLDISGYQRQLNSLYETYEKFASLQPIDLAKKLGIEHLRGYTGPMSSIDDLTWAAMKRQAEVQEVASQEAEKHRLKLQELTNAFAAYDAQVEKSNRIQANYNQSRRETTASLRQQSEALVKSRQTVLRGQEEQLRRLLSNGVEGLGSEQYNAVRNALRGVREEMRQIETVMQRLGSYSTRNLFSIGRGGMDYTPTISHANQVLKENTTEKQKNDSATKTLSGSEQKLSSSIQGTTESLKNQSRIFSDLKTIAAQYLSVWGAQNLLNNIIEIGGQLEQQRLSIGAILRDMAAGQHLFEQIKSLALTSPFGVMELDKDTKQLAAYGFKQSELFDMTKRLADISAGAGTEVSRLALALGHVRSEGALSGYTLRQFAMNNIPMLGKLSERLTEIEGKIVSTQEIRKRISKKEIGYEDVIAVIKDLTNEGGMFFNMQETMAEAVNAKFKNLRDSMDIMYSEIAESKVGDALKRIAETLMVLTRNWETTSRFIGYGTAAWIAYKIAVMGANTGLSKYGAIEANTTMKLNAKKIALNLTSSSVRKLTADEIDQMVALKLLTKEQLLNAVASKKLTVDQVELAAATFNVSRAELQQVASSGTLGVAMSGLKFRMQSLILSVRGLGVSLKSMLLNPVTLVFAAITAGFEIWQRWKQKNEDMAESIKNLELKSSEGYRNLSDTLSKFKNTGKMDETGYITAIGDIIDALKNYAPDVNNILKEAYAIDDLGKRYEYLRDELEKTKIAYGNLEKVAGSAVHAADESNLPDEIEDYIEKVKKQQKAESDYYQNRAAIEKALNQLSNKYEGFKAARRNKDGSLKTIAEQSELVRGNNTWNNYFSASLYSQSQKAASAWNEFNIKLRESEQILTSSVEPAITDFANRINNDYIGKFGENWKADSANIKTAWMEIVEQIDKVPGMTDKVKNDLLDKIFNKRWGLKIDFNTGETTETLVGWRKEMQDYFDENKILLKIGVNDTPEDIEKRLKGIKDDAQASADRYGKVLIGIGFKLDKLPSELPSPLATPWNQQALESYPVQKAIADGAKAAADKFHLDITSKKEKTKGNKEDKNAKAVREKIRVLKEVADAYQYWREKVGDQGAWIHVQEEFGNLLDDLNLNAKNVNDLRGNLKKLDPEINKIKDKKVKTETFKERDKELAQLTRKDYEEDIEKFASKMQIELDSLTRSWEIFNSVREATGNVRLAEELSGVNYLNGKNRNLADAMREKLQKDFDEAGGGIRFDIDLDDKQIEDKIKAAVPRASEDRIKGLVDAYKKWRDLQRDVLKNDIQTFAKIVGSAKDYDSQLKLINNELEKQIEANQQLVKDGVISQSDADNANETAVFEAREKAWKASVAYSQLFNNSLALTRQEIENGINYAMDMLNEKMNRGLMTAQEYADEMEKIRNIQSEWNKNSFFGTNTAWGAGIKGGSAGRVNYYNNQIKEADKIIAAETQKARKGQNYNGAALFNAIEQKRNAANNKEEWESMENLMTDFDALAKAMDPVIKLFDELGMKGIGGVLSAGQSALSSAASTGLSSMLLFGSAAGPWGAAAGAALSLAGSAISAFGADYAKYDKAKAEYENLISVWDDLIDRKRTYLNESWGTEASNAAKESLKLIQAEIEQTKELAKIRLNSGSSAGSHSIGYRMWEGSYKYNGQNWKDVAGQISSQLGVPFRNMDDMLNMTSKQLLWIKENYSGLWAHMDTDFRDHLENIIKYGDDVKDILDDVAEKLNGLTFNELMDSYYDFVTTAEDANDVLAKDLESKLKEAIVKGMIENLYQDRINEVIKKANELGKNNQYIDSNGNIRTHSSNPENDKDVASEYTAEEYALIKKMAEDLGQEEKNTYEMLKALYGWTDDGSSSSSNSSSIKNITEQTGDLIASYVNGIRAHVAIDNKMIADYFPQYLAALTASTQSLRNLEEQARITASNTEAIKNSNQSILDNINALRTKAWKLPVA